MKIKGQDIKNFFQNRKKTKGIFKILHDKIKRRVGGQPQMCDSIEIKTTAQDNNKNIIKTFFQPTLPQEPGKYRIAKLQ